MSAWSRIFVVVSFHHHLLVVVTTAIVVATSSLLIAAAAATSSSTLSVTRANLQCRYQRGYSACFLAFQQDRMLTKCQRRCSNVHSARHSSFLNACRLATHPPPPLQQSTATATATSNCYYWSSSITMMPEGPEVRALVDQLQGGIGRRLVDMTFQSGRYGVRNAAKPDGWHEFAATMTPLVLVNDNKTEKTTREAAAATAAIEAVDIISDWACKGKFIYILLDKGRINSTTSRSSSRSSNALNRNDPDFQRSIWITLGMTGRFLSQADHEQSSASQRQHARWVLQLATVNSNTTTTTTQPTKAATNLTKIYYHDARSFGTLKFSTSRLALLEKLQSLGPDILKPTTTTERDFVQILSSSTSSMNICKFLMNQAKISGIGNYILAEGLYRARIDPFASLDELDEQQQRRLFRELQAVAMASYQSKRAYQFNKRPRGGQEQMGEEQEKYEPKLFELQCYGRKFGLACGQPVIKEMNGPHGRTIWYTEQQLFMPRSERRAKLLLQLQQQGSCSQQEERSKGGELDPTTARGTRKRQIIDTDNPQGSDRNVAATSEPNDDDGDDDDDGNDVNPVAVVANIVQHLRDDGWKEALHDALHSNSFQQLALFLQQERRRGAIVYPPDEDAFAALNLCPLHAVKVVIVGQDPYHGPGQGHGLAFSVRRGVKIPPSLQNIFREINSDEALPPPPPTSSGPPQHGNLEDWAKQGVLLLNTVLTVRRGEANSHTNKGWEDFTDAVIQAVVKRNPGKGNDETDGVVFLLWGNPAHKKAKGVDETNQRVAVIRTSHPSPLGATKTNAPFMGSRCFSRANEALQRMGKTPIDWNVAP
jgi:uracil-DNA glycosylase